MTRKTWAKRIKKACEEVGTYKPAFDSMIDALARILELRDDAQKKFEESGGDTIVKHTNKAGQTNTVKNPALVVVMDCNAQALAYWRDLGLSPAGLKRINEAALKEAKKETPLERALMALGGGGS